MYLRYYGLQQHPFHITPDPEFLFASPSHREAFAGLVYGIEQRKGFITMTGEVGTGKTTVLRAALDKLRSDKLGIIYLFNPDISFDDLLQNLLKELGQNVKERRTSWMLNCLNWVLINHYRQGGNMVLVIDEAQNMPAETLEKIRVLSNLETSKQKLLQIVLVGQPELDAVLRQHSLRQLTQRIAVKATLKPLTRSQSEQYIHHRVKRAGGGIHAIFAKTALKSVVKYGRGIPRRLNVLCDNALIAGYGNHAKPITANLVHEVARDLYGQTKKRCLRWMIPAACVLAISTCSIETAYQNQRETASAVSPETWQLREAEDQLNEGSTTSGCSYDQNLRGTGERTAGTRETGSPGTEANNGSGDHAG